MSLVQVGLVGTVAGRQADGGIQRGDRPPAHRRPGLPAQGRGNVAEAVGVGIHLGVVLGYQRQAETEGEVVPDPVVEGEGVGEGVLGLALPAGEAVDLRAAAGLGQRHQGQPLVAHQRVVETVGQGPLALLQQGVALLGGLEDFLQRLGAVGIVILLGQRVTGLVDRGFLGNGQTADRQHQRRRACVPPDSHGAIPRDCSCFWVSATWCAGV